MRFKLLTRYMSRIKIFVKVLPYKSWSGPSLCFGGITA